MSYTIEFTPDFEKGYKKLAKKYASLKNDFKDLVSDLEQNPTQGTPLGNNCYKIRLSIKSKAKGKSAGARIITYLAVTQTTLYLLSIYDKSDKDTISHKELKKILSSI